MSSTKPKKHADQSKHKSRSIYVASSSEQDQASWAKHRSSKPSGANSDQDQPQHDPHTPYYVEVALADIPSQYAEEVDTFKRILSLPDLRECMPRSSTSVMGLDDETGRQELRPRGPSSMFPLSSVIKDAFDKFEHDFKAANLPEGKYIKPPPSTAKWYKVGQPCYEEKIQELNIDLKKICITPKPSGAPMGKVPLSVELEHQARQNISTLNFTAAFAKTSSSCNATLEKYQNGLKLTFKRLNLRFRKVPILRKQPNVDIRKPVNILTYGIRLFLFNTEPSHVLANCWPIYSRGSYIPWVTLAYLDVKPK